MENPTEIQAQAYSYLNEIFNGLMEQKEMAKSDHLYKSAIGTIMSIVADGEIGRLFAVLHLHFPEHHGERSNGEAIECLALLSKYITSKN